VSEESAVSADDKKAPARRGPRKEADIRAEVEAEMREKLEAEIRAEAEAKIRAEVEEQFRAEAVAKKDAEDSTPVNGLDIIGDPKQEGSITVNFVEDGLTLLGKVWYRGEELVINPGTKEWDEAAAVLRMDEFEQEEKWGRRFFRPGLWRGKGFDQIDDPDLSDAERAQLQKAEQKRRQRLGL